MSERGMTSSVKTETEAAANRPFHLVTIEFSDETLYLTDSYKTITFGGHGYTALGHLLGFSDIEETAELQVAQMTGSLSGVDQTLISSFLSKDYLNRPVKVYKGFLDVSEALIADPVLIFDGRMDRPVIEEDPDSGESVVTVTATNQWSDFERTPGRHTNHEEQQIWFSGDKGFAFASEVVKDIVWGRK